MKSTVFLAASLVLASQTSLAQSTDPVDKNNPGPYAGAQLLFGQSKAVGDYNAGPAYLIVADLGYGMKRDTWGRLELGVELGVGKSSTKDQDTDIKTDIDVDMSLLLKAGYGYSLGDHAFGFFRAGAGIIDGSADTNFPVIGKVSGDVSGTQFMLGWDAMIPASPTMDFIAGVQFRIANVEIETAGRSNDAQINSPLVNAGFRARF